MENFEKEDIFLSLQRKLSTPVAVLFMIYDSYQETEGLKTSIDANG